MPAGEPQIRVADRGVVVTPDPLPFTPYGLEVYKSHRPTAGPEGVVPEMSNDPRDGPQSVELSCCAPQMRYGKCVVVMT